MNFNNFSLKIDPLYINQFPLKYKVIGFRGIRDNLGTTTILSHVAEYLGRMGKTVCVLDFDFCLPNTLMSTLNTLSIRTKLDNNSENIIKIINRTKYKNVTYIGANQGESIVEYLPLEINTNYYEGRIETISILVKELLVDFDCILVDIPSDLRIIDVNILLDLCDIVFTTCIYQPSFISKLQKDKAVLSGRVSEEATKYIINVGDYDIPIKYNLIDEKFVDVSTIPNSSYIVETILNNNIKVLTSASKIGDFKALEFYTGILEIVNFIKGE